MIDVILYPLLLSVPLAALVGPVGSVLVWRRSSFLSDVVSHMGILAFAIAHVADMPVLLVSVGVSVLVALLLEWAPSFVPKDAWLAGLSSLGIAAGLVILNGRSGTEAFGHIFWGDVFTLSRNELIVFIMSALFLGIHLFAVWNSLILVIFHERLAALDGVQVWLIKCIVNVVVGTSIALCLKVMGVLLTGAMFVLPSIGLRTLNLTPEKHIFGSIILILGSFLGGLAVSVCYDVAMAPWVIITLIGLNGVIFLLKKGIDRYYET